MYRYRVRHSNTYDNFKNWIVFDSCSLNIFKQYFIVAISVSTREKARKMAKDLNLQHPLICPKCLKKKTITYERFSKRYGEFVCDECGWATPVPKRKKI